MEFLGHSQTASYMTGPRTNSASFLPSVGPLHSSSSAAHPMRRSLTALPWRPATYFQSARQAPTQSLMQSQMPMSARTTMAEMNGIKVPPVFSAARNALYARFTPNDWINQNLSNYTSSDRVRSSSERVRFETLRVARDTDDRTRRTQNDVGKHLGERLVDISYWKTCLKHETDNIINEIAQLIEVRRMAEKSLAETQNPLHVAQECLYNREKRQNIDLVHDDVEKDLLREIETIKNCQDRIRRVIDKANAQVSAMRPAQHELERDYALKETAIGIEERAFNIRNDSKGIQYHNGVETVDRHVNRHIQHQLENDAADKCAAEQMDNVCFGMTNTSAGLAFHNGVEVSDRTISVPDTWAKFSNDNIQRSQAERSVSKSIRHEIEHVLNACSNDMYRHWNQVNAALSSRTTEVAEARNRLQEHLSKVLQEIFDMERNIEYLKRCIAEKEAPMRVAQSRLDTRNRRPNIELCRDPAQHRLVSEVYEIRDSIEFLHGKLRDSENVLQHLLRQRSVLEAELSVKNNSLFIDREKCMSLRKTFLMTPRVASY